MDLELTHWQAVILREMVNLSNVKGSPCDDDCLSLDDMVIENLIGKGYTISCPKVVTDEVWKMFRRLDNAVGER